MNRCLSVNKQVAVEPLPQAVIEKKVSAHGIVLNASRTDMIRSKLVMDYLYEGQVYAAGEYNVVLRGDAPFAPYAKSVQYLDEQPVVLVPESAVIAFERTERDVKRPLGPRQ